MSQLHREVHGTLQPDGTLVLDETLNLPPGRVTVVVKAASELSPPKEDWWQYMQRVRAEREAAGYPFMNEAEMAEWIEELRGDDDRIEEACQQMRTQTTES